MLSMALTPNDHNLWYESFPSRFFLIERFLEPFIFHLNNLFESMLILWEKCAFILNIIDVDLYEKYNTKVINVLPMLKFLVGKKNTCTKDCTMPKDFPIRQNR